MPDFHYTTNGFYFNLIPLNTQAEDAWRKIDEVFEGGSIPFSAWEGVRKQLKSAGYSVIKAKKATKKEMEAIFLEMEALGL